MSVLPLCLFNSYTARVEDFVPQNGCRVGLYSCGPTVYHTAHLGNLRAYVFTDTLRRALRLWDYDVSHVMNITDVGHLVDDRDHGEDKIEKTARKQRTTVEKITLTYTDAFLKDIKALNIVMPTRLCRATEHIDDMIAFAQRIEHADYAYRLADGLYFDTAKVPAYGALGGLVLEGQKSGHRVKGPRGKRNPHDFVLWRCPPKGEKRLLAWASPWGEGTPGWHLECSVMSLKYLGQNFDIHTGGMDHKVLHHCNEIAQNQAYCGSSSPGARFWMHNGFLVYKDAKTKMSKSSGEMLTLGNLLERGFHPLAYKYFLLTASYREPILFSWDALVGAHHTMLRLAEPIARWRKEKPEHTKSIALASHQKLLTMLHSKEAKHYWQQAQEALRIDLATPKVLAHFFAFVEKAEKLRAKERLTLLALYDAILGLDFLRLKASSLAIEPDASVLSPEQRLSREQIDALLKERHRAREQGDFQKADAIREQLTTRHIALQDTPNGSKWHWQPIPPSVPKIPENDETAPS